jgi:glutathione S-transferase
MPRRPLLWHIEVSHYNEKARWALDYKGVPHERRAPLPGVHMAIALWLTRGNVKTFPVLELDGQRIGDSSRIIEALETRFPDPRLYPVDPDDRARVLALEDFIDEEVAPHVRLLGQHEAIKDRENFNRYVSQTGPWGDRTAGVAGATVAAFLKLRYRINATGAPDLAKRKIEAGLDRLEAVLDGGDYLVGDTFTVADLTGAAVLYPLVRPPEGPQAVPPTPEPLRRYFDSFAGRPALRWVSEMFSRHRGTSSATRSRGVARA